MVGWYCDVLALLVSQVLAQSGKGMGCRSASQEALDGIFLFPKTSLLLVYR